jgi:hypothetical protein
MMNLMKFIEKWKHKIYDLLRFLHMQRLHSMKGENTKHKLLWSLRFTSGDEV